MKTVYSPGCALLLYKPALADRVLAELQAHDPSIEMFTTCCHHTPDLPAGTCIINTCPGCDRRFGSLYEGITTLSLWEYLAHSDFFPLPDHSGLTLSVHDSCPVRGNTGVHEAVRTLLTRMHIEIVEAAQIKEQSVCCGDSFYPHLPVEEIHKRMRRRAQSMPCQDVSVCCISCIKSMTIGGRRPHYLVDLLFGEDTIAGDTDIVRWHEAIDRFIATH